MDKGHFGRRDRLVQEKRHDTYQEKKKCAGPGVCSGCGAVFANGRWSWQPPPGSGAGSLVCPACARIADNYPAGQIVLKGQFFEQHRTEIANLIRNAERQEKQEHPLERLMAISEEKDRTVVTTTGIHLARRIGEALASAYQGELTVTYGDGEKSILVTWVR